MSPGSSREHVGLLFGPGGRTGIWERLPALPENISFKMFPTNVFYARHCSIKPFFLFYREIQSSILYNFKSGYDM